MAEQRCTQKRSWSTDFSASWIDDLHGLMIFMPEEPRVFLLWLSGIALILCEQKEHVIFAATDVSKDL